MKQYVVDAFTNKVFHGNQAAVCVLDKWPNEALMKSIARENNFSETAFTVKEGDKWHLRWFTPGGEIDLCGHATLGTAYVLFRFYEQNVDRIVFTTLSGDLIVTRKGELLEMNFPVYHCKETTVTQDMAEAFGATPCEAYIDRDLMLVFEDEAIIREMKPDFDKVCRLIGQGVGVTAPGEEYDFVSRFFAPKLKVNEDPVTGSAHCMFVPYWAKRLGKNVLKAYQASERGGELQCELQGERVVIAGKAVLYSVDELFV